MPLQQKTTSPLQKGLAALLVTACFSWSDIVSAQTRDAGFDKVLREWVAHNIYFENSRFLLIRKRAVRADIRSDDPKIVAEARDAISILAGAFGLDVQFVTSGGNLFVVTADGVAEPDGTPKASLLASLGITESGIKTITALTRWRSGCGNYSSRDSQGQISASVIAADKSLPPEKIRTCVVTGILYSFGLRTKGREALDSPTDYVQFLLLARSLAACDHKLSAEKVDDATSVPDLYVGCIVNRLKSKLFE